ncbi:LOW QUALITY PROTEIN: hypothetical protein PanWU01x14_185670 [Parasponia andersonii]|uniref:Uncharacterized protein n=1 Tax=Parasponia andersonii TaxID=3476 RepID=A0A2P5C408_PARAD|nr:LOW QUALITY PROTEIN: hypothetical protein PanWU01x14_185670 [Parasponia andersonii]
MNSPNNPTNGKDRKRRTPQNDNKRRQDRPHLRRLSGAPERSVPHNRREKLRRVNEQKIISPRHAENPQHSTNHSRHFPHLNDVVSNQAPHKTEQPTEPECPNRQWLPPKLVHQNGRDGKSWHLGYGVEKHVDV